MNNNESNSGYEKKLSPWLIVLIVIILLALIVCVAVALFPAILVFAPASWWCALSFNQLPGCPIY